MRIFSKTAIGSAVGAAVAATALLGGAAYADPACPSREVSLYFEPGQTSFNDFSKTIVERLAEEARSCQGVYVIADAPSGALEAPRAAAISSAFQDMGVKVLLVGAPPVSPNRTPAAESVLDRAASVRVQIAPALG